jgi:flagellar hook-associated protein 3 FlgL
MQETIGAIGARGRRIEMQKDLNSAADITLTGQLSDVEDIDLPKVLTDLQIQQASYQAALAATSRVIQPTLVDFLR